LKKDISPLIGAIRNIVAYCLNATKVKVKVFISNFGYSILTAF